MENGLSLLESGEAKILGVMVEGLKADVHRVETGVNTLNNKMDILQEIKVTQVSHAAQLDRHEEMIEMLDERVDSLESHRDTNVVKEEVRRWGIGTWLNIIGILAAIGLVVADIAGLFHR